MSTISPFNGNYSYDFYLRTAYSKNRYDRKSEYRSSMTSESLVTADADAMKKLTKKLRSLDYDADHATEIFQNTKAFIDTYNNLLGSSETAGSSSIQSLKKQLAKMTKNEKEDLSSIGIELKSNGELKIDADKFLECKPSKIATVLSSDSSFTKSIQTYASRIYRLATKLPVTSYTGSGKSTSSDTATNSIDLKL